jgi:C-terminal processing protease CtpA/Prc
MNSLGLRYWSRFRITIDFPGSCLYLEPGAPFNKPEPLATSGMMLKWIDRRIQVENVREHSTAKKAGVEPGDVLLEIDGRPMTEYDPFQLRELLTSQADRRVSLIIGRGERRIACELVLDKD